MDSTTLELRLRIPTQEPLSPREFVDLFRCGEALTRQIVEREAFSLLEYLEVPHEYRLSTLQDLRRFGGRTGPPAEVTAIEKGSWVVVLTLTGSAILWALKEYLHPVVLEAWNESSLRDRIHDFFRDRLFQGARRAIEEKAIESPRYGNLQIKAVEEPPQNFAGQPKLTVRLERRAILEVSSTDRNLVEDFLARLRK